jgi:L-fuconolactonase
MSGTVDAHVHLWDRALDPQDWIDPATMGPIDRDFGPDDLAEHLAATGLEAAVVVQSSNSLEETLRLVALDGPAIGAVVGWVDLCADVPAQLARVEGAAKKPLVGIRHLAHIDPDPEWLLRPDVGRGLAALADRGKTFDLVVRDWQLPQAARVAATHEGVQFVLDHLAGPPGDPVELRRWAEDLRELARRPNVVAKLSGLVSGLEPGTWGVEDLRAPVEVALEAFGPGRILYGSDWPLVELGGGGRAWRAAVDELLAGLSADDVDRVLGANAARVYGTGAL